MKTDLITCFYSVVILAKCYGKNLRIIGGKDADRDLYNVVVLMKVQTTNISDLLKPGWMCTGAAVSQAWVLTAAHCLAPFKMIEEGDVKHYKRVVRYGNIVGHIPSDESEILDYVMHPAYFAGVLGKSHLSRNDIGLLMTTPILLDFYAKLSSVDLTTLVGLEAVAAGFGRTKRDNIVGSTLALNKSLQILDVLISKCPEWMQQSLYPSLCAVRKCNEPSATACPGDSGGPLLHSSGIVAVASKAICLPEYLQNSHETGFYTPISPYIDWITSYIAN